MPHQLKILLCTILFLFIQINLGHAQSNQIEKTDIYRVKPAVDFPITGALIAGTILTYPLRDKKDKLDTTQAMTYTPEKLSSFNRHAARQFNESANQISDYIFYSGFGLPALLFMDKPMRKDAGKITLLYFESLGALGVLDGLSAGTINKLRPYVYNPDVPLHKKLSPNANGSFFGSHPAFTAACSFFCAKIYNDYHPQSKSRFLVWSCAGALTAASSYFRYKGGEHFVGDIAVGIGLGALSGILIPEIHRIKHKKKVLTE